MIKEKLIKKLEELGAEFKGDNEQKRYVYDIIPKEDSKWVRLRTNGRKTTLTYKNVVKKTIDGTKELEVEVSDFEKTNELLENMGIKSKGYQENKRTQYILNGVQIDIDSWPMIPTYVEIEGKNEEDVMNTLEILELPKDKVTTLDVDSVYKKYRIDLNEIKVLKFKKIRNEFYSIPSLISY